MFDTFILIFYLILSFVLPYLCGTQSKQWGYDIKLKRMIIFKMLIVLACIWLVYGIINKNSNFNK